MAGFVILLIAALNTIVAIICAAVIWGGAGDLTLARNELRLVYQPLVGLKENRVTCLEAHVPAGTLPEVRRQRTSVTLRLEARADGTTRLWFEQTGWGRGGQWDEAYRYFESAWPTVLARLHRRFAEAPVDWKALPAHEPALALVRGW